MKKYKIGYTQGAYDLFHLGHLNLLKSAKERCEKLYVGINSDNLVKAYKNKTPIIPETERCEIVKSIKCVDDAFIVDTLDKKVTHQKKPYDAIFIGDDWKGNQRWADTEKNLTTINVDVVYLPHTKGISSSFLREKINETTDKTKAIQLIEKKLEELEKSTSALEKSLKDKHPDLKKLRKGLDKALSGVNTKLNETFYSYYKKDSETFAEAGRRYYSKIPKATGTMRLCQLAGVYLLKELDKLLAKLEINYFLHAGNLLGYVRTGGTIPWDDDIDVTVLLEDIIKLAENINKHKDFKDFELKCDKEGRIKFYAKGYHIFIDLICGVVVNSMKEYEANISLFDELKLSSDKDSLPKIYNNGSNEIISFTKAIKSELDKKFIHIDKSELDASAEPIWVRSAVIFGAMKQPTPFSHIYPIQRGLYEGIEVSVPKNPDFLLAQRYNNYWHIPIDLMHRRSSSKLEDKVFSFCDFVKSRDSTFYKNRILPILKELKGG